MEYFILIIIASMISLPVAYWGIQKWLNDFAIKIQITGWLFFLPIVFILTIALITVSSQALIAAVKNPVDHLKNE